MASITTELITLYEESKRITIVSVKSFNGRSEETIDYSIYYKVNAQYLPEMQILIIQGNVDANSTELGKLYSYDTSKIAQKTVQLQKIAQVANSALLEANQFFTTATNYFENKVKELAAIDQELAVKKASLERERT